MNVACGTCGAVDPNAPCPIHNHAVGMCPQYADAQVVAKMEDAWVFMKAKIDAPNYRHASKSEQMAGKICGTCKAWDDSATEDPQTGYCEWYDFTCNRDHTCDAWAGRKK